MTAFKTGLCRRRKYSFTKYFGVWFCSKLHLQLHIKEAFPHYKEALAPGQASSLGAPGPQTMGFSHRPVSEAITTGPLPESWIWGAWCGLKQNQTQSSWREVRQVLLPFNIVSQIKWFIWKTCFSRATDPSQPLPGRFVPSSSHACQQPPPCHSMKSSAVTSTTVLLTPFSSHVGLKWHYLSGWIVSTYHMTEKCQQTFSWESPWGSLLIQRPQP